MNDSANVQGGAAVRLTFSSVGVVALGLFAFLLLMGGAIGLVEIPIHLAFGWIVFLIRTIPKISVNADMLVFSLLCLAGTLLIAHRFITWVVNTTAVARSSALRWHWKWTGAGFIAICLLLLVGMSVVGLVHQIGWLFATSEPMYTRSGFIYLQNRAAMTDVTTLFRAGNYSSIEQFKADVNERRIAFDSSRAETIPDRLHVLVLTSPTNHMTGVLVFPRDPKARNRFGGWMVLDGEEYPVYAAQISETIKTNQTRMISLY